MFSSASKFFGDFYRENKAVTLIEAAAIGFGLALTIANIGPASLAEMLPYIATHLSKLQAVGTTAIVSSAVAFGIATHNIASAVGFGSFGLGSI